MEKTFGLDGFLIKLFEIMSKDKIGVLFQPSVI